MPDSVVDASALAAVTFREPDAVTITSQLRGQSLLAPPLLFFELAHVARTRIAREPWLRAEFAAAFSVALRTPIRLVEVDHRAVLSLAQETGLTAYDAPYLWLAEQAGADLVTLDSKLDDAYNSRH